MKRLLCQILLVLAITGNAQAEIVLNEGFTYPDGNIEGAPGSPWVQHSGTSPAIVNGGKLVLSTSASGDVHAPLLEAPYTSGSSLYVSFIVKFSSLPSPGGSHFAHFSRGSSDFRGLIWPNLTEAEAGMFRIGVQNSTADPAVTNLPVDLALNTEYKVVVRYVIGTGVSTIWVNPTSEVSGGVTATTLPNSLPDASSFAFRQNSGIGMSTIDDLLVGTTFDDVVFADLPPTISVISDQSIPASGSTEPLQFVVGDDSTPPADLQVSGVSDNQTLLPENNIVFSGSGGGRTVALTPVFGLQGKAKITVTVSANGAQTSMSFNLRVGAPSIAPIENQITRVDAPSSPVAVIVDDAEEGGAGLAVAATSDNQQLIADGNISLTGAGTNRQLVLTPSAGESGLVTITVTANDGFQTASAQFRITVHPDLGLLISDNFNRADGLLVDGLGDWISHSGAFQQTMIADGRVQLSHIQTEDAHQAMTPGMLYDSAGGYVFFASWMVRFSELPAGNGSYFAHFKDDGFSHRARVIATTNGAPAGKLRLGIANAVSVVGPEALHPENLSLNNDYLIVVRFNLATGESRLWVDPMEENSGFVDAIDPASPSSLEAFALRQAGGAHGIGILDVDNLQVATTFSDVVSDLPPVIHFLRSGDNLRLSWPSGNGFELRRSTALPAVSWTIVPTTEDGPDEVTNVDVSSGNSYFRLERIIQ